jgi:hypothetical protein
MIDIVAIGPLQGYNQIGGAAGFAFVSHRFTVTADGQLAHYSDEQLRAVVPPEGWQDYLKQWPEAQALVDGLTLAPALTASVVGIGIKWEQGLRDSPQDGPQGSGIVPGSNQAVAGG